MFFIGMLVGIAMAALLVLAAAAWMFRVALRVRCDTCGVMAPPVPLQTERTEHGVRMRRPNPPEGWRKLPNGDDQCERCAARAVVATMGHITDLSTVKVIR